MGKLPLFLRNRCPVCQSPMVPVSTDQGVWYAECLQFTHQVAIPVPLRKKLALYQKELDAATREYHAEVAKLQSNFLTKRMDLQRDLELLEDLSAYPT